MSDLSKQAMTIIKNRAKAQGLTQQDFAKNLGVSLATIKRWYGGGTISLDILKDLCHEVGMTVSDVLSAVENQSTTKFSYTREQEEFFADEPSYLAFFDQLLRGYTPAQIQKKFQISARKLTQMLSQLEKLKLIEWLPHNKVRLLVAGEPVWLVGGPLAAKLRREIFQAFLESETKSKAHFFLHDYLDDDLLTIKLKIEELIQITQRAHSRAKYKPEVAKPMGFYLSLQDFRWNMDHYLK